jgi:hypothetical protein
MVLLLLATMYNKSVLKWLISIIIIGLLLCKLYDFLHNIYVIYFNTEIDGNNIVLDAVHTSKDVRLLELDEKIRFARSQYLEQEAKVRKLELEYDRKANGVALISLSFILLANTALLFIIYFLFK